jgi:hypothetical protein
MALSGHSFCPAHSVRVSWLRPPQFDVPLGWYNVEVWFPNNPYPRTFKVVVNQMPVSNVGTIRLNMPMGMQSPQGVGGIPGQRGWVQTGF